LFGIVGFTNECFLVSVALVNLHGKQSVSEQNQLLEQKNVKKSILQLLSCHTAQGARGPWSHSGQSSWSKDISETNLKL